MKNAQAATEQRITYSMRIDGPRKAVFDTAELLEKILLCLPPKRVLVVQRVSKQFKELINTSVMLQHRVWMKPAYKSKSSYFNETKEQNARLWRLGPLAFSLRVTLSMEPDKDQGTNATTKLATINPLVTEFELGYPREITMLHLGKEKVKLRLRSSSNTPASWRDMYITEPPCTRVTATIRGYIHPSSHAKLERVITDDAGLTYGSLVDGLSTKLGRVHTRCEGVSEYKKKSSLALVMAEFEERTGQKCVFDFTSRVLIHETAITSD